MWQLVFASAYGMQDDWLRSLHNMVKKPKHGNGTSRVRFIMLEAELPDGDLSQITSAIQNALKPPLATNPRTPNGSVKAITAEPVDADE